MDSRLIPVNAALALLRGDGGWPAPFAAVDLRLHRIEAPISTDLSGVVVDVLAYSEAKCLVVPIECKSGGNIEEEQAKKYAAMTVEDVARQIGLPFPPSGATVVPMFSVMVENVDRIKIGLRKLGLSCPLLIIGNLKAILECTTDCGLEPFSVETPMGDPPGVIPVDAESADEEYLELLLPEIVASASRGEEVVAVADLLTRAVRHWSVYGRKAKSSIRKRAEGMLRRLFESKKYRKDFRLESGGRQIEGKIVRVLRLPGLLDPRGQTQGWQRLRRGAEANLRGRELPPLHRQLSFEDLALEVDLEDNS